MKRKLCRWLYYHHMSWLAWYISPSITLVVEAEIIAKGIAESIEEWEKQNGTD